VRLRVRLHARRIDDRLVAGEAPEASMEGRVRSDMLLDPGNRASVADALRRLVAISGDHKVLGAGLHVKRKELHDFGPLILSLADEIEGEPDVRPRGIILADRLVRDGESPVYWPRKESVEAAVNQARAALHMG
jgi:hypothetical protein